MQTVYFKLTKQCWAIRKKRHECLLGTKSPMGLKNGNCLREMISSWDKKIISYTDNAFRA